jgi:hypothetical protein
MRSSTMMFCLVSAARTSEELTALTGITPDRVKQRGRPPEPDHLYWDVNSGLPPSLDARAQFDALWARIAPAAAALRSLDDCRMYVECIVTVGEDGSPILTFDLDVLQKVVSIGATLDVDVYVED